MSSIAISYKSGAEVLQSLRETILSQLSTHSLETSIETVGASRHGRKADCTSSSYGESAADRLLVVRVTPTRVHFSVFPLPLHQSLTAPCPECLDKRLESTLTVPEQAARLAGFEQETHGSPYLLDTVLDELCLVAGHVVEQSTKVQSKQRVWTVNLASQQTSISELMIDSFCTQCSSGQQRSQSDVALPLRTHLQAQSGKSRMKALTDYELPMRALINDVCGVAGLHAVFGYAQSITAPIYGQYAQRAFSVAPRIVSWSGMCTRSDESRIAGTLESLERQAGMLAHPDRIAVFDSFNSLQDKAMNPEQCFAYNDEAYQLPLGLTRYSPDLKMEWVWGYSLLSKRSVLVPKQLVYYDRLAKDTVKLLENSSSGCALGSCYEEAILRALLELLERDSFVIAWYRELALPRIDPESCRDRKTRLILDRVKFLGYDMSLLDGRLDMEIPVVIAVGRRRDQEVGSMVVGASASTDANDAVRGALLEAATSIVEVPSLLRSQEEHIRKIADDHYLVHSVSDHGLLYGLPHMAEKIRWLDQNPNVRSIDEAYPVGGPCHSDGDIAADLDWVLAELRSCGVSDVVAVDVTTREQELLELKTIRMIVPGLAPLDFGFPRNRIERLPRLRSAPAAAGLFPVGEDRINPLPHPFP